MAFFAARGKHDQSALVDALVLGASLFRRPAIVGKVAENLFVRVLFDQRLDRFQDAFCLLEILCGLEQAEQFQNSIVLLMLLHRNQRGRG